MMTKEQTDFVLGIQARYELLDLEIPGIVEDLLSELFGAILRQEDLECARICGSMILELECYGDPRTKSHAARWLELFGELVEMCPSVQ